MLPGGCLGRAVPGNGVGVWWNDRLLKPTLEPGKKPTEKRPGSAKRKKTKDLRIDQDVVLKPDNLPPGAVLEGCQDFVVQDLIVKPNNTCW